MIWHNATPDEVLEELEVSADKGLSDSEACDRLKEYGHNLSVLDEELSIGKALISQLKKPSVIVLLSLLVIFVLRQLVMGTNSFWLPIAALALLATKEAIFIYSEYRSVNMLFKLKNRVDTSAKVLRNGVELSIPAVNLVPGDIILLSEGDFIPADARLIEAFVLRCDESVLLGEKETVTVEKDHSNMHEDHTPVTGRSNMVYCGSCVLTGSAKAVVTETGENAEVRRYFKRDQVFTHKGVQDRIAERYSGFLKVFNASAFFASIILTVFATFLISGSLNWGKFLNALIIANCFYLSVIPHNFSARLACMLALGVKRLQKDRAVIFHPSTVEKLAGVTVICADKTGTLTQNRMVLREVFDGSEFIDLSVDNISKRAEVAMRFSSLSCDVVENEIPDHTEAALVAASSRYLSISKSDFDSEFPRVATIPLTPERKIKTTVNMIEGKVFAIVRGAPDIILERCIGVDTEKVTKAYEEIGSKGMRVLAISYKILDDVPSDPSPSELEYGLEFLGLLGLRDRERKGTSDEIALCRKAGISTVMFTGDHFNTASSVAEAMGILRGDELAVTGEQLDGLSDEELVAIVDKIKVCARISPEQRVRIVNALHQRGDTVLITADSAANHAPMAIADVGCGMGKTGTDVAIGNADVVVDDDRFVSIVRAIKNSRGIFSNFRKYAEYYVTMCSAAFFASVLCMLFFGTTVLSPQLLLMGAIFALVYPLAALGYETADNSTMSAPPWSIGSKMFDVKRLLISAGIGVGIATVAMLAFIINRKDGCASSAAFTCLLFSLVFYMFSCRSDELFYKRILHNRFLMTVSGIALLVTLVITATPLGSLFGLTPLCLKGWLSAVLLPLIVPLVCEAVKFLLPLIKK